jgi:hypothetical protein
VVWCGFRIDDEALPSHLQPKMTKKKIEEDSDEDDEEEDGDDSESDEDESSEEEEEEFAAPVQEGMEAVESIMQGEASLLSSFFLRHLSCQPIHE